MQLKSKYSTCKVGALAGTPSKDSAVRSPVPVMIMTIELPLIHPGLPTISSIIEEISAVCWSAVATLVVFQAGGFQVTLSFVVVRPDTS